MRVIDNVKDVELKTFPGGDKFSVLVGRHESTGASQHHTVAIVKLPPGTKSDEHYHKEREESYYIIEGNGFAVIDGKRIPISEGALVHTKPNERHQFLSDNDNQMTYLIITAPRWVPEDSHQ